MAMADEEKRDTASCWGTLEELLLACAINRHGTESWDFIAVEVQKRATCKITIFPKAFTPHDCKQRYHALKCRFDVTGKSDGENYVDISEKLALMIDELRRLRVEELRREVERHDVSIVSLQLKVKRLEDEADLRKGADRRGQDGSTVEAAGSDRCLISASEKGEPDRVRQPLESEPDKVVGRPSRLSNQGELKSSVSESKQSSDVTRKRRRSNEIEVDKLSPANNKLDVKSQPLIKFLEILRSHKHGLVFHRRLPTQKTHKYKKLIRQHMDVETVESKVHRGLYSRDDSFYRDLLLIFTNAVVFFPKSSPEHLAARELRKLITKELIMTRKTKPDPAPQNKKPPPSSSVDIVVCRRRRNVDEAVRNKGCGNGKDTPMRLKRDRTSSSNILSSNPSSNGDDDDDDDDALLLSLTHKRKKEAAAGCFVKKKVVDEVVPKTTRVSGRRPLSSSTTANNKPRRR